MGKIFMQAHVYWHIYASLNLLAIGTRSQYDANSIATRKLTFILFTYYVIFSISI